MWINFLWDLSRIIFQWFKHVTWQSCLCMLVYVWQISGFSKHYISPLWIMGGECGHKVQKPFSVDAGSPRLVGCHPWTWFDGTSGRFWKKIRLDKNFFFVKNRKNQAIMSTRINNLELLNKTSVTATISAVSTTNMCLLNRHKRGAHLFSVI